MDDYLKHHGIPGQKWGERRYQNEDGSLTEEGRRRYGRELQRMDKMDERWAKRKGAKIEKATRKAVSKEISGYAKTELKPEKNKDGKLSSSTILRYNTKLAQLMNNRIGDLPTRSGRVLRFVAKRGDLGVHMGFASKDYNMDLVKRGVFSSGKVAYKNENLMKRGG